jgi:tryptophan 2,3-dioxygenase
MTASRLSGAFAGRSRVLGDQPTLDEAYRRMCESDVVAEDARKPLAEAMTSFARAMLRWRRTHYRLAVRMLGDGPGTVYTEGTPYLRAVRDIPVFHAVEADEKVDNETTGAP